MSVKIIKNYQFSVPFNIEKTVQKLLKKIPNHHLVGLEYIVLVDEVTNKRSHQKGAVGTYNRKYQHHPAKIEIAVKSLYDRIPRIGLFFPLIPKHMLAGVLYHEIGHHYHHHTGHGIKKEKAEVFTEHYSLEMMKKVFFWWAVFLYPISKSIHWCKKLLKKVHGIQ